MSKDRNRGNREAKKPKAAKKKPAAATSSVLKTPTQATPTGRK